MADNKLSLATLEAWLWDSANILRGSIDSSDFKNYIFGLLFLKRSNDVFEEEVENIMKRDGVSREDAEDETYFQMPVESRWETIKKETENIGIALDKAFAGIERENTSLEGVMTATKFGDKEKLSDELLQRLLRHFNQHSLRNSHLESNDLLGDAYEYLIKMFADDAGKKGGEFYTPRGVVQLIVQLIKPEPKQKIYDPTCGSGGMLIESARYIAEQPNGKIGNNVNVSLFGQEKNLGTWAIGKLNMLLHNFMDADIRKGDTLITPQHKNGNNELDLFDRVIANPPFSMDGWWTPAENSIEVKLDKNGKEKKVTPNYAKVVTDPYGRFQYGIPPRGYADLAFLQHMVAVLKQDGRAGVVLPHGTLFRSGAEGMIRQGLLEADLVEGIIGLPSALFYNTGIPASIWIINKNKTEVKKGKVIIIDASNDFKEGKNQNELEQKQITKIVKAYDNLTEVDKYMRIVSIDELAQNDYNLNITRFIDTSKVEIEVDIKSVYQKLSELELNEKEIDTKMDGFLKELGLWA
ncbi:MAG: SAM-dependent DNA methyltransferase [Flavobacterium sp.]|nr:MAG: SAM-dependent DNA methyltransferase [Flavobacterium sp.]